MDMTPPETSLPQERRKEYPEICFSFYCWPFVANHDKKWLPESHRHDHYRSSSLRLLSFLLCCLSTSTGWTSDEYILLWWVILITRLEQELAHHWKQRFKILHLQKRMGPNWSLSRTFPTSHASFSHHLSLHLTVWQWKRYCNVNIK